MRDINSPQLSVATSTVVKIIPVVCWHSNFPSIWSDTDECSKMKVVSFNQVNVTLMRSKLFQLDEAFRHEIVRSLLFHFSWVWRKTVHFLDRDVPKWSNVAWRNIQLSYHRYYLSHTFSATWPAHRRSYWNYHCPSRAMAFIPAFPSYWSEQTRLCILP